MDLHCLFLFLNIRDIWSYETAQAQENEDGGHQQGRPEQTTYQDIFSNIHEENKKANRCVRGSYHGSIFHAARQTRIEFNIFIFRVTNLSLVLFTLSKEVIIRNIAKGNTDSGVESTGLVLQSRFCILCILCFFSCCAYIAYFPTYASTMSITY